MMDKTVYVKLDIIMIQELITVYLAGGVVLLVYPANSAWPAKMDLNLRMVFANAKIRLSILM